MFLFENFHRGIFQQPYNILLSLESSFDRILKEFISFADVTFPLKFFLPKLQFSECHNTG